MQMTIDEVRSRVREAEHIIEDVLNNLMDDTGLKISNVSLTILNVCAIGEAEFETKARIELEVKL